LALASASPEKSEIAKLKSKITLQSDSWRRPWSGPYGNEFSPLSYECQNLDNGSGPRAYENLINILETISAGDPQFGQRRHGSCEVGCIEGTNVPKRDSSAKAVTSLSSSPGPESPDDIVLDAEPTGSALVPIARPMQRSRNHRCWMPNPIFLTHLIATAERAPQTRELRRASLADARTAYHGRQHPDCGRRMRQDI
jgi:hypothetical protein